MNDHLRQPETRRVLHSWDELPEFKSDAEEAAFWEATELGPELLAQMKPPPKGLLPPPRERRWLT